MSNHALSKIEQHQLALLHAHLQADNGLSAPFAKETLLLETYVAGTSHIAVGRIEPTLTTGGPLVFRRESSNPHDPHAILILTEHGEKLGYIPRDRNEILAHLMDAGKLLFGRLESKEWTGDWLNVSARVFLRDV